MRPFSKIGIGSLLSQIFDQASRGQANAICPPGELARGKTLLMVSDFGGQHRGQKYETYAFLVADLDVNQHWLEAQSKFRRNSPLNRRRISFKAMNDSARRRTLAQFLRMAETIEGHLVIFAISKSGGSLFGGTGSDSEGLTSLWKKKVLEKLLRVMHFTSFLLSGLSCPGQDVLWIADEDEIAANVAQLAALTQLLGSISSHYLQHDLGHLRCGTTKSDDGTLVLEDLASVPDLVAGAFCEVATAMWEQKRLPVRGLIKPIPAGLSWKSQIISSWLADQSKPLRHWCCLVDLDDKSPRLTARMVEWQSMNLLRAPR